MASGCIRAGSGAFPERLAEIYRAIDSLIEEYRPAELAIEEVFLARNASSALKLGQAAMQMARLILQAAEIDVRYIEARDGHNWENWRDRLREGLSWLFPGPLWLVYE